MLKKLMAGAVFCGLGLLAFASSAKAESINLTFNGSSLSGGGKTFSYIASGSAGNETRVGDYFVLYDFKGFTGVHSEGPDWTFSVQNSGPTPPAQGAPDNPFLPNLVWTFNGATTGGAAIGFPAGYTYPIPFTAESSIIAETLNEFFSAQDHQFQPIQGTFTVSGNTGQTTGPNAVPVPASVWGGLALLSVLGIARAKKHMTA